MHDFGYHALLFFDIFSVRGTASGLFSQGSRCACCQTGVVEHELDVAFEAVASGEVLDLGEQEGGRLLAADAQAAGLVDSLVDGPVDDVGRHGVLLGDGVGDEHATL